MHVHSNYIIAIYMYMERSVNISTTSTTRVNNICFSYFAISDDISRHADFPLMVTMVVEFCPLVILIHNTLLGEITISST